MKLALNPLKLLSGITQGNGMANALFIITALAIAIILLELLSFKSVEVPVFPGSGKAIVAKNTIKNFTSEPIRTYQEIIARPLFYESRQPIADESGGNNTVLGSFELTGVVITADKRAVLLKDKTSGVEKSVAEGEKHNGWLVEKVEDRGVTLRSGERIAEVSLKIKKSSEIRQTTTRRRTNRPSSRSTNGS